MLGDGGGASEDVSPTGRFKVNGSKLNADERNIWLLFPSHRRRTRLRRRNTDNISFNGKCGHVVYLFDTIIIIVIISERRRQLFTHTYTGVETFCAWYQNVNAAHTTIFEVCLWHTTSCLHAHRLRDHTRTCDFQVQNRSAIHARARPLRDIGDCNSLRAHIGENKTFPP